MYIYIYLERSRVNRICLVSVRKSEQKNKSASEKAQSLITALGGGIHGQMNHTLAEAAEVEALTVPDTVKGKCVSTRKNRGFYEGPGWLGLKLWGISDVPGGLVEQQNDGCHPTLHLQLIRRAQLPAHICNSQWSDHKGQDFG